MTGNKQDTGLKIFLAVSVVLGIAVVAGTIYFSGRETSGEQAVPVTATAEYGRRLLRETVSLLGPDQENPQMRYTGNRLDCASCHLETGTTPGTLSLLTASSRYPRFSGRDGGERDLRDRINGCMQRSMNGQPLPHDSVELIAMESYILGLGNQFAAMSEAGRQSEEPAAFVEPQRMADVEAGKIVYEQKCRICHGENGEGLRKTPDIGNGYMFPPLWGPDSYNNGAGMNRVLTAGRFIKARMPLGAPDLSNDQAYDVSAYINSQPRPEKANLEMDYPDLTLKPVDSPYPPYADNFSRDQHRLGPFAPIREYYERLEEEQER